MAVIQETADLVPAEELTSLAATDSKSNLQFHAVEHGGAIFSAPFLQLGGGRNGSK